MPDPLPNPVIPDTAPSIDTTPAATDAFDSAFNDIAPTEAPKTPESASAAPSEPAKPAAPAPTPKADDKAASKPADAPAAEHPVDAKPTPADAPKDELPRFTTNKQLREYAYTQAKKVKEFEAKIAELEKAKDKVAEADPKTAAEQQALAQKAEALQKRIEEYEHQIRLTNYEQSAEYKEKYLAPYQTAVDAAAETLKELFVTEDDAATGDFVERPAKWDDFKRLFDLPLGYQAKEAKKLFGEAAPIVMQHISDIKRNIKAAQAAKETYRTKASEIEKERTAKEVQERERQQASLREMAEAWGKVNDAISNDPRGQAFWGKETDDAKANEELAKGFSFADKRFSGEYHKLSNNEKVTLDAAIRHRVAGFYKLSYVNQKLRSELAEKDKLIASLRGSTPAKPAASGNPPAGDDNRSPLEKMDDL